MNALTYILQLTDKMSATLEKVGVSSNSAANKVAGLKKETKELDKTKLTGISNSFSGLFKKLSPILLITAGIAKLSQTIKKSSAAYEMQSVAENKLAQVMRNTMGASREEMDSILKLTEAQGKLGVIGDEVQLAGAQELATYLTKKSSLEQLIPVMNDMMAQQFGLNASQEQASQVASMLGKVMDGQVGALSRYGYKFDEAQEKILKAGTEAQRAAVLFDVVNSAVGGMNAALAQTPEGKLKQVSNDLADVQERIGKLIANVKLSFLPVSEMFGDMANRIADFFERNQEKIRTIMAIIAKVVTGAMSLIYNSIRFVKNIFSGWINGLRDGQPVIIGITALVGILTTAVIGHKIAILALAGTQAVIAGVKAALFAYQTVVFAIKNATSFWTAAQWLLNVALSANPVGLIIAGIVALIAVIAFLIIKIDGWGQMWEHTMNGCKLIFKAYIETVKYYFNTMIDGLMIGLNKIKEGWYKFKEAVGIGDSSENQKMLREIQADTEARKTAIIDGAKNIVDLGFQAAGEFKKAAGSLSWNDTSFSDVLAGMKNKLGISSPGIPGTDAPVDVTTPGGGGAGGDTANSIATGGTKTTNITINIGEFANNMRVTANGAKESAIQMRDIVLDEMTRVLTMAQGQV